MTAKNRPWMHSCLASLILVCALSDQARHVQNRLTEDRPTIHQAASPCYVAIGDSTGLGIGASNGRGYVSILLGQIQSIYPEVQLKNLCSVNATSSEILDKRIRTAGELRAAIVTISLGAVDLLQGSSEEEFSASFEKIVQHFENTKAPIVVTNIPDITFAPRFARLAQADIRARIESFNARIGQIARQHNAYLVDLYRTTRQTIQLQPEFFSLDGMHPSDKGYQLWAEAMWPAVKKAITKSYLRQSNSTRCSDNISNMKVRVIDEPLSASIRLAKYWLPVATTLGAMYYFSTDVFSADNTRSLIEKIYLWFRPHASQHSMGVFHYFVRKSLHFAEYAILGALLFRAFRADHAERWRFKWAIYSFVTSVSWALLDELHQSFTKTRGGSIFDSLLDSSGAFFALVAIAIITRSPRET